MKNISCSIIFLLGSVATTFAALALGPAEVHQNEPGKCFESEGSKYHAPGESWNLDNCGQATCFMSNHSGTPQLMVSYASCGSVHAEPPCYIKEDKSRQYPDCCPEPICPENYEQEELKSGEDQNEDTGSYQKEASNDGFNDEENEIEGSNSHFSDIPYESLVRFQRNGKLDSNEMDINYPKEMNSYKYYNQKSDLSKASEVDPLESSIMSYLFPQYSDYQDDYISDYNARTRKFSPKFHHMEPSYPDVSYQWF